jgi:hypothetical protein
LDPRKVNCADDWKSPAGAVTTCDENNAGAGTCGPNVSRRMLKETSNIRRPWVVLGSAAPGGGLCQRQHVITHIPFPAINHDVIT